MEDKNILRLAAIGDLHTRENDKGRFTKLIEKINEDADILILTGDLTDTGDEQEAEVLLGELAASKIPIVCVLGNHDYEKGRQKLIKQVLLQNEDIYLLDGEGVVLKGVGFAGVKGFGGGFDNYM